MRARTAFVRQAEEILRVVIWACLGGWIATLVFVGAMQVQSLPFAQAADGTIQTRGAS